MSFSETFDSSHVFQLPNYQTEMENGEEHSGRILFNGKYSYQDINDRYGKGWKVVIQSLDKETTLADYQELNPDRIALFIHRRSANNFYIVASDLVTSLDPGDRIICMVDKDTAARMKKEGLTEDISSSESSEAN
jgi:hypothetical protein